MRPWERWLYVIAGLAAAFVTVAAIVQAVRQGSWGPIAEGGWVPAVVVATWPRRDRRCELRRRGVAG